MTNYDTVEAQLHERLAGLLQRVGQIEGDLRSAHDADWPERANELQNDEVLEGLDDMTLREVQAIRGHLVGQFARVTRDRMLKVGQGQRNGARQGL